MKYLTDNCIAIDDVDGEYNWKDANELIKLLVNNKYAVMVTLEENLIIINYVETYQSSQSNRNDVVFMSREDYEYTTCYDDEQE